MNKPSTEEIMDSIVTEPSHYADLPIEPVDFIMRNEMTFALGNSVKYIARAGRKAYPNMDLEQSAVTDLRKAIRYLEMEINLREGKATL